MMQGPARRGREGRGYPRRGVACQGKAQHGFDGKMQVVPALVECPYNPEERDVVTKNIQESTLESMRHKGSIDEAQKQAGDWFRRTYESTRAGSMAVDPSRTPVDTSGIADPIPDRMITASQQLAAARAQIGYDGYRMVELVCGEGWSVRDASWGKSKREREQYGFLFRLSLNRLAVWLGYATKNT